MYCCNQCDLCSFFLEYRILYRTNAWKKNVIYDIYENFFYGMCSLFLIITGYLMCGKKLSAKYFYGIVHTIIMYIIISLFCILNRHIMGQEVSLKDGIKGILDYTAAPYAWYVEMYIGLFVMIPFLNIL